MSGTNPNVLIVDDNPGDILLIKEALAGDAIQPIWHEARNAEDALAFFERLEKTGLPWRPAVVLLDMNMPIFRGIHVLDFIKSSVIWRGIPVVMWTSSDQANDKESCRIFGADDYFTKPIDLDRYRQTLLTIFRTYLTASRVEAT